MLQLDLQRFAAGEKTERATPKRRADARKEGNIPKSTDLTSAVVLVGALFALKFIGPMIWSGWMNMMTHDFSQITVKPLTEHDVKSLLSQQLWIAVRAVAPLVGIALVLGLLVSFIQTGPVFLPKLLVPDFSRVQISSGFKRLFSARSFVESVKSVAKLAVVGVVIYMVVKDMAGKVIELTRVDISSLPGVVGGMAFQIGIDTAIMMLLLATLDFLFQRFEFEKSIRMSREELKEEARQQEGDPKIKSTIRARGRRIAMQRMMQEVPKADVVVTNPTHFAVALKYDSSRMAAPEVIAKGQDDVALRIRRVAQEAGVPQVENRPLAQTLYRTVEIGNPVPSELYQAVAEVLAYVYRLKETGKRG